MEITDIRNEIDCIDDQLKSLFEQRMHQVLEMAKYKEEHSLPVLNASREREVLARVTEGQDDEMAGYTKVLFTSLFDLSRAYQSRSLYQNSALVQRVQEAMAGTPPLFPKSAVVACQGIEGSNSQLACDRLFSRPNIMYFSGFDAVFTAVNKGLCRYGILPIENSLWGSVGEVYDLMRRNHFHIVKSIKVKIEHALLAKSGTELADIREIVSHEQALGQCSAFLKTLPNVKITACDNTATAAKLVAESQRTDLAAIASADCGALYNLVSLSDEIALSDHNYTRFICIAKEMEIYPGADKISIMFTVPHRPGSLYGVISKFSALGVNLNKLESRPIPGKDFEFMFYADFEAELHDQTALNLLAQLEVSAEKFVFLGNYSEK
ncbi:MAG: bifunctional chorismate mutase/prephenate dehydratase [Clostridiales bacterium]|nr:bifunctional chorismate mutase/prephenate dehydratase [Clostridiales bacterium]